MIAKKCRNVCLHYVAYNKFDVFIFRKRLFKETGKSLIYLYGDYTVKNFSQFDSKSAYTGTDPEKLALFTRLCEEKGIEFLDLTETYLDAYEQHVLPFGFSNTAPLTGHLNRQGHRLFAEAVAARIAEREG